MSLPTLPIEVRCPFCQAHPGQPCVAPAGATCSKPHLARLRHLETVRYAGGIDK